MAKPFKISVYFSTSPHPSRVAKAWRSCRTNPLARNGKTPSRYYSTDHAPSACSVLSEALAVFQIHPWLAAPVTYLVTSRIQSGKSEQPNKAPKKIASYSYLLLLYLLPPAKGVFRYTFPDSEIKAITAQNVASRNSLRYANGVKIP